MENTLKEILKVKNMFLIATQKDYTMSEKDLDNHLVEISNICKQIC